MVTLADVIEAHERALRFGGRAGVLSLDLVESAIARPYTGYYPAEQIILAAAGGRHDSAQVVTWFEQHLRPVTPDEGQ